NNKLIKLIILPMQDQWSYHGNMTQWIISQFNAFWPTYLGEFRTPSHRTLHFVGTSFMGGFLLLGLIGLSTLRLGAGLLLGFATACLSQKLIEKNRPIHLKHPFLSFLADWKLWFLLLTGHFEEEVRKTEELKNHHP